MLSGGVVVVICYGSLAEQCYTDPNPNVYLVVGANLLPVSLSFFVLGFLFNFKKFAI